MHYSIINTGSDGNCTIVNDIIAIDMGVSYKKLSPYVNKLQLILLTHIHGDHFNKSTIRKLANNRPTLKFGCCEWLVKDLIDCGADKRNIHVYDIGTKYNYRTFSLIPIKLYHDVPQCGYRLFMNNEKLIYATDTKSLEGIKALEYDVYLIEGNYENDEELKNRSDNDYYYNRVKNTHLSKEYATNWLLENMGLNSVYEFMHQHKDRIRKEEN